MGKFKKHGQINKPYNEDEWNEGWWPDKVGPGEIYTGEEAGHFRQVGVLVMDILIKGKKYEFSRCSQNLLALIVNQTTGQVFSNMKGARLFWKLPKNSELAEKLDYSTDQISRAIRSLAANKVIIRKGYRERWVCVHPRLFKIRAPEGWDKIQPDRNWWVNTLKGKIWHYDPREGNLSGREHAQIDQALERAIKYAEKSIKGFKCRSKKCRDKMNSGLEQMEKWWKEDRWHRMRSMVFRVSNEGKGEKKLRDKLTTIKGPENLFGHFIFWVKNLQKERDWFQKITPGTFQADGKPIREFSKDLIQGVIAAMLKDYGGISEPLLEVLEDDKRSGRRKSHTRCPDGKARGIIERPSAPFGKKIKKAD